MSGAVDRDFFRGLDLMDRRVEVGVKRGIGKAALQLMDDAINQAPRIPHDEGTLQGSASVFVGNKLTGVAPNAGGQPTPALTYNPPNGVDEFVGTVGFNTPYAAYQHEGVRADGTHPVDPANYTRQDGRGPKYLETPMAENGEDYRDLWGLEIKRELSR